ncbi:MAG: 4-hydroxythreonine-4-phosphate dehydrogenase PdxA [Thermodesulfovibrionales bacterium]|nr:4-hydroxythreonine-4-phosphate dehydrogenase PdxA [Thermodesulfovibrionales bacterium]
MKKRKKIALTIGDPAGIGTEIVLKAVIDENLLNICNPVIVGDRKVIEEAIESMSIPIDITCYDILDVRIIKNKRFKKSIPTKEGGIAAYNYIKKAVELASLKIVDAIVTAPISKESLKMANFRWPGHTEMLAELTQTKEYAMMFYSETLKLILVTTHIPFKEISKMITKDKVLKTIILAKKGCDMMGIDNPKLAIAGLNPHAGETGIFGEEEIKEIIPAIEEANKKGIKAIGPFPPDTLFWRACKEDFDVIVCMYHDQGLIPFKMLAFNKGVNLTVGLPFIRTSPDHGTAFDIAWKGLADQTSMIEAIKLATKLKI